MHVIARGRLTVYEKRGDYQLVVDALEPHGLGALQAAFEQLKKKLHAEGLFEATRKRPLPALPRRIGVVTSLDGAAVRDILRVLTARHPSARVLIRAARVQGDDAARDLVAALKAITRVADVDVVIIGRGGGSVEDLWAFNEEILARAIAACPVPVISAVGHEGDFTIADFVADVRAATPSNAAELVVERADHMRSRIERADDRLSRGLRRRLDGRRDAADRLRLRLKQWPIRIAMRDRDIQELALRLDRCHPRQALAALSARVARIQDRLTHQVGSRTATAESRARELAGRLDALSPLAVLGRGYAVCWNEARTAIIRSATAVQPGDGVRVTLAHGEIGCRVEST
jgi:exodeoxyribonuclease VII large subunit